MSKKDDKKPSLLDRGLPKWKKQTRFGDIEFTLGGRIPDGWTIRDILKCSVFVLVILLALLLAQEIGLL